MTELTAPSSRLSTPSGRTSPTIRRGEPGRRRRAFLIVSNVAVGHRYIPTTTWLGFHLNAAYPASDIYPHYVGVSSGPMAVDSGRRSPRRRGRAAQAATVPQVEQLEPAVDNAANKAERILKWLADR